MRNKKYWGIATLILLLGITGVFLFMKERADFQRLKEELAESNKLLEEQNKKIEQPPLAREGFKMVPHGDHWHEVPIDAPDVWQEGTPEPVVEMSDDTTQSKPVTPNLSVAGEVEITQLPQLPADIDPDDIPPFYSAGDNGKKFHYNRPLTSEEREMYYTLKADPMYKNSPPAGIKMSAIILVRQNRIASGALAHIVPGIVDGSLTSAEARALIAEFYEMSR